MATIASRKKSAQALAATNGKEQAERALAEASAVGAGPEVAPGGLAPYKARRTKRRYTQDELERVALTRAVLEVLEKQEPLYP